MLLQFVFVSAIWTSTRQYIGALDGVNASSPPACPAIDRRSRRRTIARVGRLSFRCCSGHEAESKRRELSLIGRQYRCNSGTDCVPHPMLWRSHRLCLRPYLVDVADVEEGLLGQVVGFAVADFVEAFEGLGDGGID